MELDAMDICAKDLYPDDNIPDVLRQIDAARPSCAEFVQADAKRLQEFCHLAVRHLREFLRHVAHVKLYSLGDGPEVLKRALHEALDYMKAKVPPVAVAGAWRVLRASRSPELDVAAADDIRNRVRGGVRLHVDAVVDAAVVSDKFLFAIERLRICNREIAYEENITKRVRTSETLRPARTGACLQPHHTRYSQYTAVRTLQIVPTSEPAAMVIRGPCSARTLS